MGDLKQMLHALAECDERATELEREAGQIPGLIVEAKAKAEEARACLERERQTLADTEARRRAKERELQECEAQRDKFQSQTAMVKTNVEYTALLHEVDGMVRRISDVEEEILLEMEQCERLTERMKTVESEQTGLEKGFLARAEELRTRLEVVRQEITQRNSDREQLVAPFPPDVRSHYKRIRAGKGTGLARVGVQDQSCRACHRQVPPETINRAMAGEEVYHCPACQRILIVEEA